MLNAIEMLALHSEKSSRQKNIYHHFDSEYKWLGPLLRFVIARTSVQNPTLHLEVERSGLRYKVKCKKIPNLRKDQNQTIIASICNTGSRGNFLLEKSVIGYMT